MAAQRGDGSARARRVHLAPSYRLEQVAIFVGELLPAAELQRCIDGLDEPAARALLRAPQTGPCRNFGPAPQP